jgi:hypothetical protein
MIARLILLAAAGALFLINGDVRGHHSFAAEFTAEQTATITGTVTEVWFRNPHVRYYIDVKSAQGTIEQWDTRGGSPSLLTRRGWTRHRIKSGDTITLKGHRAHEDDRKLLSIIWVELADGTRLE